MVLCDAPPGQPARAVVLATGSEVGLALQARQRLLDDHGIATRVVSMPSAEVYMLQSADYRESVLPAAIRARVAVEASHIDYWWKFVGLDGKVIGMTTFGESAPAKALYQHFGITVEAVVSAVNELIG